VKFQTFSAYWLSSTRDYAAAVSSPAVGFSVDPRQYVIIRAAKENEWLLKGFIRVLGMKPHFQYQDKQGQFITEWRMAGREARWSSMQGVPTYKNPRRLDVTEE
jgi:hypothetical protein